MAQHVQVLLVDDIDGGEADETVSFAIDGAAYEIDLSIKHAEELREFLAPYVGGARKVNNRKKRESSGKSSSASSDVDTAAVRAWAQGQGYEISSRGRIPAEVVEAYKEAQSKLDGALSSDEQPTPKRKGRKSKSEPEPEPQTANDAPAEGVAEPETDDDSADVDDTPGVEGADEA